MAQFIVRRLIWTVVTLLSVSLITFVLIFASGDPAFVLTPHRTGETPDPELVQRVRVQYNLDKPLAVQYVTYIGNLLRGEMGYSYYYKRPVSELMFEKFPNTLVLAVLILIASLVIGLPLGIIAAVQRNQFADRIIITLCTVLIAIPAFLLALLLIYAIAFKTRLLPLSGHGTLQHLILPVLSVALPSAAGYAIFTRTNMLNHVRSDYARTARAKGLTTTWVAFRHVLPNAIIPVVTLASLDLAFLMTGIVLIESVFQYPGIGLQVLQAVQNKDVPVVMGSVFYGALLVSVGGLVADILVARLDPRIRVG